MTATYYLDPEDIITDFLRRHLTDPRARAENTASDNVTATAGQTEITLTPTAGNTVSAIISLTVNAVAKTKWLDYYWDYQNQKITFYTALSLNDAVVINFKEGTSNWIYSDRPSQQLVTTNFPRISVFMISNPGSRVGNYQAPIESNPILQIDIWCKDKYTYTVGGRTYSGKYLARYLGNQITKAFEENESDLFPTLYNYRMISGPRAAPYSIEFQAEHSIVEISFKGLKTGRIEVF